MSSILVVDDEAAMREFYRRALTAGGYLPVDVRTAEEALDHLAMASDIEVVVADLNMPGKGGEWLVAQMRERYPNVAVILATANEQVSGTLSLQPSVVSYLVKPIPAQRLLDAVQEALQARATQPPQPGTAPQTTDPIESFLDRKLTHQRRDDDTGE